MKEKVDKIFGFILLFLVWLWFTSLMIGGALLIGDGEFIQKGSIFLCMGWFSNLGLLVYFYFFFKKKEIGK